VPSLLLALALRNKVEVLDGKGHCDVEDVVIVERDDDPTTWFGATSLFAMLVTCSTVSRVESLAVVVCVSRLDTRRFVSNGPKSVRGIAEHVGHALNTGGTDVGNCPSRHNGQAVY
jgi:hypothetical protein